MPRLYQITVRWGTLPENEEALKPFEDKIALCGPWMRFSAWSWIVHSNYNPSQIRDALRASLNTNDHFLVLEMNATGADGWATPWIWQWIRDRAG
jgi:hypothetical protein